MFFEGESKVLAFPRKSKPIMWHNGPVCRQREGSLKWVDCQDTWTGKGERCPWCGLDENGSFELLGPGQGPNNAA